MTFEEYFENEFDYKLDEISFHSINPPNEPITCEMKLKDELTGDFGQDSQLNLKLKRIISFEPAYIYELTIVYSIRLKLKKNCRLQPEQNGEYWAKLLLNNPSGYLGEVCSRISMLVANITGANGKPPAIIPPIAAGLINR